MSEQVFISYRRVGGDVSAKLICEALKNKGFTVFYDYDSLHGGFFDTRILNAIEGCDDFVLVLPPHGLDRCVNDDDWVRQEIVCALKHKKNIVPVMLQDFSFPTNLPEDISVISRINGVPFSMPFFDAMIGTIADRMVSSPSGVSFDEPEEEAEPCDISKFRFEPNEDGGYTVFSLVNNETDMVIPGEYNGKPVTRIGEKAFYRNEILTNIKIPNSVTVIESSAFENCSKLTTAPLPRRLQYIGGSAFEECRSLKAVVMPNSVTYVGSRAFKDCWWMTTLKLSASLTRIEPNTFYELNITEIVIPPSVMFIGDSAFRGCHKITHLEIPNSVTEIGGSAFSGCSALTKITLPNNITGIPSSLFFGCKALTEIKIPDSVTVIADSAFYGCTSLRILDLNDGLTVIGWGAFQQCSALKWIDFPSGLESIGDFAFEECSKLTDIHLHSNLKSIGNDAFNKCRSLKRIYYYGGKENWKKRFSEIKFPLLARKFIVG